MLAKAKVSSLGFTARLELLAPRCLSTLIKKLELAQTAVFNKCCCIYQVTAHSNIRPQIRRDYPLNLSILISGGKETNKDSLSNGERKGKSPAPNLVSPGRKDMWRLGRDIACAGWLTKSLLNGAIAQGGCQARTSTLNCAVRLVRRVGLLGSAAQIRW